MPAPPAAREEQARPTDELGELLATVRPPVHCSDASSTASQLDAQRQAVHAMGQLCTKGQLSAAALQQVTACLLGILGAHAEGSQGPEESAPASRLFFAVLRTLQAVLLQVKEAHQLSLALLLECLKAFWAYGTLPSAAAAASPASAQASAYLPPHQRSRGAAAARHTGARGWRSRQVGDSSGSELSDCEGSDGGPPDRYRASRVRLASLGCLQALAKANPKALHPFWAALLPVDRPLAARPTSRTLMDAVAADPIPQVRACAAASLAAMLEGEAQRAYLGIAEARTGSHHQPVRGFTTLSGTLGKLALRLHEGLLQAAASEADPAALAAVLRALCALAGAAPYPRLPPGLLPRLLTDVHRCLGRLPAGQHSSADAEAANAAAVACLGAAAAAAAGCCPAELGPALAADLLSLAAEGTPAVRHEALLALQPIAVARCDLLCAQWAALAHAVSADIGAHAVSSGTGNAAAALETVCSQAALKLLGSYLEALGQAATADDGAQASALAQGWQFAAEIALPQAFKHSAASVRAAAVAVIGVMSSAAHVELAPADRHLIWQWLQHSCTCDAAAGVRAAGLKAVGNLALLPSPLQDPGVQQVLTIVEAGLAAPTQQVQLAAAWALANLADGVTQHCSPTAHRQDYIPRIAQAAIAACHSGDKVRANAVRAVGYILAAPSREGTSVPSSAHAESTSAEEPSTCSSCPAPPWFPEAAQQLQAALRIGNGKVSWNACYAVGSLLRRQKAARLAHACGCLQPLLLALLAALQHSSNQKTQMHAAAALTSIGSGSLASSDILAAALSAALAVRRQLDAQHSQENDAHGNEGVTSDQKSSAKATFASMQSAVALQRQLDVTILHLRTLSCNA